MADQEYLASFGVEIDEGGVSRLQSVLARTGTWPMRWPPLSRRLLAELSPAARESLSLGDGASSMISAGLAAGQPAGAQITQNNSNVSAPVTIQVRSTGADAEQVGRSLYDTAERYLLRTLQSTLACDRC